MKKKNAISLTKETRDRMVLEIKSFFANERDEEIGDLAAGILLDFILEKIGPEIYNLGVEESYRYLKDAAEDLLSVRV